MAQGVRNRRVAISRPGGGPFAAVADSAYSATKHDVVVGRPDPQCRARICPLVARSFGGTEEIRRNPLHCPRARFAGWPLKQIELCDTHLKALASARAVTN
jgi:hypothetical protein